MNTLKSIERAVLRLSTRERFQLAEKILASLLAPGAMNPSEILAETIRREADGKTPIREIKRKQLRAWFARDEAEMLALRVPPPKRRSGDAIPRPVSVWRR